MCAAVTDTLQRRRLLETRDYPGRTRTGERDFHILSITSMHQGADDSIGAAEVVRLVREASHRQQLTPVKEKPSARQ